MIAAWLVVIEYRLHIERLASLLSQVFPRRVGYRPDEIPILHARSPRSLALAIDVGFGGPSQLTSGNRLRAGRGACRCREGKGHEGGNSC
jgi:hypothetical protein